jgi:hypothetical protein
MFCIDMIVRAAHFSMFYTERGVVPYHAVEAMPTQPYISSLPIGDVLTAPLSIAIILALGVCASIALIMRCQYTLGSEIMIRLSMRESNISAIMNDTTEHRFRT